MSADNNCFFCDTICRVDEIPSLCYTSRYSCEYCGEYLLDPQDSRELSGQTDNRFKIACVLNERRLKKLGGIALDDKTDVQDKVLGLPRVSVDDILDEFPKKPNEFLNRTLLNLSRLAKPTQPFGLIRLNLTTNKDCLHFFIQDKQGCYTFLHELAGQGYIRFNRVQGGEQWDVFSLTTKCWNRVKNQPQIDEIHDSGNSGNNSMEYDVFISHASEDKVDFVEPLANALTEAGVKVWYDRFELKLGDSLRGKIDEGLANSRYGVVVLSNSFFKKEWPKTELDALVSRQNEKGGKVILPIWHGIGIEEVKKFSPILASKLAAQSSDSLELIVVQIKDVLNESSTPQKPAKDKRDSTETEQDTEEQPECCPTFHADLPYGKNVKKRIDLLVNEAGCKSQLDVFYILAGTCFNFAVESLKISRKFHEVKDSNEQLDLRSGLLDNMCVIKELLKRLKNMSEILKRWPKVPSSHCFLCYESSTLHAIAAFCGEIQLHFAAWLPKVIPFFDSSKDVSFSEIVPASKWDEIDVNIEFRRVLSNLRYEYEQIETEPDTKKELVNASKLTTPTRYERYIQNFKENKVLSIILVCAMIVIAIGMFTDALDKIISFSKKHLSTTYYTNKSTPDTKPVKQPKILGKKVAVPHETKEKANKVSPTLPDENDSSQISVSRLLIILKSAYTEDRLPLVKRVASKLTALSTDELKKILGMLYQTDRVDGLKTLLPSVNKSFSDNEINTLLVLFYKEDVPKVAVLLINH